MNCIENIIYWIIMNFNNNHYLLISKIQIFIWSLIDLIFIFSFLRITDFIRKCYRKKNLRPAYLFLILTAIFLPFIFLTDDGKGIFYFESILCGIQYLILIISLFFNHKYYVHFFKQKILSLLK